MPRSRRKAAASRLQSKGVAKDFVKKKERLGRKSRPANATDVSVRAKQVYLPNAAPAAAPSVSGAATRGLALQQLVVRATHYSAVTRQSALNGLARALGVGDATASSAARSDISRVLHIALAALQDESAAVRAAAVTVLAAALSTAMPRSSAVAPFAPMIAARVVACLTHIRAEVQIAGAQAVCAMFSGTHVLPDAVFGEKLPLLLAALSDLLAFVKAVKNRTIVLDALFAVVRPRDDRLRESWGTDGRLTRGLTPFYYHRSLASGDGWRREITVGAPVLPEETDAAREELVERVVHVITESMPVHEAKKDNAIMGMLLAAVRALYFLATPYRLGEKVAKMVERLVETWSRERNRHQDRGDAHSIHNFLAGCALCVRDWQLAGAYIELSLATEQTVPLKTDFIEKKGLSVSVEELTLNVLQNCDDPNIRANVLTAWMTKWIGSTDARKISYAISSPSIVTCIVDEFLKGLKGGEWTVAEVEESGWKILSNLPNLILHLSKVCHKLVSRTTGLAMGGVVQQVHCLRYFMCTALRLLARASRICCRVRSPQCVEFERIVSEQLLEPAILEGMHVDELEELVSVLYYTKAFASRQAIRNVVHSLHIGSQASVEFSLRLLVLVESNFTQFKEYGHENILLDLFAAVSLIKSARQPVRDLNPVHKIQWDDFVGVADRLLQRVGFVEE